jgi:tRNA (guanine37-N1)-methyltransferase
MFEHPNSAVSTSIIGRAQDKGIFQLVNHDLRDWTHDRHRTTDDEPFGGGQGLLMKIEPVFEALDDLTANEPAEVIFFAPFGQRYDQKIAADLVERQRLLLVCGRYEGFDERVYSRADRIISLGDFILTGAELAAMCLIDSVVRLLPGALGDERSARDESFSDGLIEYPQYTRPASWRGMDVPEILLSGNHALIERWRRQQSIIKTAIFRPDLLFGVNLNDEEKTLAIDAVKEYSIE